MNNIRKLREGRNLTLVELSKLVFIDDSTISRMENGNQSITDKYAIILSDFFKVSVDYLLGRTNEKVFQVNKQDILKSLTPSEVIFELNRFATIELIKINGVIDFILNSRSDGSNADFEILDLDKQSKKS